MKSKNFLHLIIIFSFLIYSELAFAETYGQGAYGAGNYSIGYYVTPDAGTSSSSGGGGSNIAQTVNPTVTSIVSNIKVGETAKFQFDESKSFIRYVSFDVNKDLSNIQLNIINIAEGKIGSLVSNGVDDTVKVYKYYEIRPVAFTNSEIKGDATVKFDVENSWLTGNSVNKNDIVLYRFVVDKWEALPTILMGEDSNKVHYSALSSGLSYFTIGTKTTSVITIPSTETGVVQEPEKAASSIEEVVKKMALSPAYWAGIILAIIIIVAIVLFVIVRKHHIKK